MSNNDMAGTAAAQFSRVLVVPRGGPVMSSVRVLARD